MSMPMAQGTTERAGAGTTITGAAAGMAARGALRLLGFRRVTRLVQCLVSTARHPATEQQILNVLQAVDAGTDWLPCRMACLERSLAAVFMLAARRRGVTWYIGVRTPPFAMHAWLADAQDEIIGESPSTVAYRPLVAVSPTYARNRSTT